MGVAFMFMAGDTSGGGGGGGGGGDPVTVPSGTYTHDETSPTDAGVTFTFSSGGSWSAVNANFATISSGTWENTVGTYYIRWTNTVGSLSSGTAGSWLALSSSRSFGVSYTGVNGSKSCTGFVEIATDSSGVNVVGSGTITITATVTP